MILLHKGQIHSDGTFDDAPIPTAAMRGEIGGDDAVALAVANGCTGRKLQNMAAGLHKLAHKAATKRSFSDCSPEPRAGASSQAGARLLQERTYRQRK